MFTKLWMQRDVIQIAGDTTLAEAKEILAQHRFRHLPVTEGTSLLGIISTTDLDKALPSPVDSQMSPEDLIIASQVKVTAFMSANPVTVAAMTPLDDVATLLQRHKIGAIPVVEEGALIGIITESDIFAAFQAIMAGDDDDVRIEMVLDKGQQAFFAVMDCCKKYESRINSISLYGDYSSDQQLMTLRINGKYSDKVIEAIWETGAKIEQITKLAEQ